jgi:uncharacterized membrane-anchored protein
MDNKKIFLALFILVVLAQLFVPAKMILDRESVLSNGKEFKFKTEPIDPTDPFRGKYITLSYEDNTFEIQDESDFTYNEVIYVTIITNSEGYAVISSVSKTEPDDTHDYFKAKVDFINDTGRLSVDFPFDRYYMEESKAYEAELVYRESQIDSNQVAYALVHVKDGQAVLKNVMIDGISIKDIVKSQRANQK